MENREKDKRIIPRHVEPRIMIGRIPFKTFIKLLPIYFVILMLTISTFTPISVSIGAFAIGLLSFLNAELANKETGIEMVKSMIRYKKEGEIHFERSCLIRDEDKRITINEIKKR